MVPAFEDEVVDVFAKAVRGRGTSPRNLAAALACAPEMLRPILRGQLDTDGLYIALAKALGLNAEALHALAAQPTPETEPAHPNLARVIMNYPAQGEPRMTVNTYWLPVGGASALIFDAGSDADAMLTSLAHANRTPTALFLTHDHPDHVYALPSLQAAFPAMKVYAARSQRATGSEPLQQPITLGPWTIAARSTPGHAEDGITYHVQPEAYGAMAEAPPIAFVGDAIFARSAGGIARNVYTAAHAAIHEEILSLPGHTILAPGHGPLTTVATELELNPFFAPPKTEIAI